MKNKDEFWAYMQSKKENPIEKPEEKAVDPLKEIDSYIDKIGNDLSDAIGKISQREVGL